MLISDNCTTLWLAELSLNFICKNSKTDKICVRYINAQCKCSECNQT